jgi:hypothetical protein
VKLLHVLKSEPDQTVKKLMKPLSVHNQVQEFKLFGENIDYDKFIELVFDNDKVICWW